MGQRKPLLLAVILFLLISGCQKEPSWNFTVEGRLINAPTGTYARLYRALPTGNVLTDSVELDKNGKFKIHGTTHGKDFFVLNFTNGNYNIYLLADSGDYIFLTADYKGLLSSYEIKGDNDSRLIQLLEQHLDSTRRSVDSLDMLYKELTEKGLTDSARKVALSIKHILKKQKEYSTNFVYKHYKSLVALPALSQTYHPGFPVFDPEDDAQLFFMVDSALGRLFPKNPHVLRMHSFVQNIKLNLQRKQSFGSIIAPGQKAPEFMAYDINHSPVKLKNFRGKYIYLIFTASWCNKCTKIMDKRENLNTNKVVKIAFSLDIDSTSLAQFVKKYANSYIILNDHRFWNSPILRKYNVSRIPTEFLIGPDGKILAINTQVKDHINKLRL